MLWHKTKFGETIRLDMVEAVGVYRNPGPADVFPYRVMARIGQNAYKLEECKDKEEAQKLCDNYIPRLMKTLRGLDSGLVIPGAMPNNIH